MKIVKTCLPGSKVFNMYPGWLHKVVQRTEALSNNKGICTVHKARYKDMTCYIFDCDETQTTVTVSIAYEKEGKFFTRIHFQRRAAPVYGGVQRPPLKFYADKAQGFVFDAQTDEQLELIATAIALQFDEPSPYPVLDHNKTQLTNIYKFWETARYDPMTLFAGKIIEHSFDGPKVHLVVEAQLSNGQQKNWRTSFYISALGGADVRNGHWLLYSPTEKAYITSTKELDRFFRFNDCVVETFQNKAA